MAFDRFHFDIVEWRPLESIISPEECAAFMYMGWFELGEERLHHYKHAISRRYLLVTDDLDTYTYVGGEVYIPIAREDAIGRALEEPY